MDVSGSDDVVVRSRACERRLRKKRHEARLRLQLAADAALLAGHHASAPPSVPGTVSPAELAALRAEVASLRALVEALRAPAAPSPPGCGSAAGGDPSGDPPVVVAAPASLAAAASGTAAGGDPSGDPPPAVAAAPAARAAASSFGVAVEEAPPLAMSDECMALLQAVCLMAMQVKPYIKERLREAPAGTLSALTRERTVAMQVLQQSADGPRFHDELAKFLRLLLHQAGQAREVFYLLCVFWIQHLPEHLKSRPWFS